MLIASLLFYQKLKNDLEVIGFKVNPYYPCVANKMIRDKRMKISWHVDELKVSHDYKYIVDALIQWTKETYKYTTKFKPSRVKIQDYLSMTPD